MPEPINERLLSDGWKFTYDPGTRYIGLEHPRGGKQSVCEMKHPFYMDKLGELIVNRLNFLNKTED